MSKKMVLIDGSNQAYRAFHAIQTNMTAPDGFPTKAIFGLVRILISVVKEHKPDYVLVVFDKGKSFRVDQFPDYKGHRPSMPDELRLQWPELKPITERFGFRAYAEDDGYEADDIIGTMAKRYANDDLKVTVISNDKDFAQLVDENITLYNPSKKTFYDAEGVHKKWKVRPDQMVDYLSIIGDKSDNIPGVKGVGKVSVEKILAQYNGFEDIYENIDEIKQKKKLIAGKDDFIQARSLIRIQTDVELDFGLEECAIKDPDSNSLVDSLQRFGLFKIISELGLKPKSKLSKIEMTQGWDTLTAELMDKESVAVFIKEVDGLRYMSVSTCAKKQIVGLVQALSEEQKRVLSQRLWVVFDYKAMMSLFDEGTLFAPLDFVDVMLDHHLIDVTVRAEITGLALRHLNHECTKKPVIEPQGLFDEPDETPIYEYIAQFSQVVFALHASMEKSIDQRLYTLEYAVLPVLHRIEARGVQVDREVLQTISTRLGGELRTLEEEIYEQAGRTFNINSPKQVGVILFEEKGLKPLKKTKTGHSTNAQTLELLFEETNDPMIRNLIRYRELAKLKGTYVDPLPKYMSKYGRIHTRLHQAITETGRLSSSDPNLQNIPIRTAEGRQIREAFVASEGMALISADYSQLELRILAHFCTSGGLVDAFAHDVDIHEHTGRDLVEEGEEYQPSHRAAAKAINYGLMYGMSAFRLSKELRVPFKDANTYINRYFARYPEVRAYMDSQIEHAKEHGFVETFLGRKRKVANINDRIRHVREGGERIAMNTPIQGTAADIVKLAMVRVEEVLALHVPEAKLVLQIHDELLVEAPCDQVEKVAEIVKKTMEDAVELRVPLKVHIGTGANWSQVH